MVQRNHSGVYFFVFCFCFFVLLFLLFLLTQNGSSHQRKKNIRNVCGDQELIICVQKTNYFQIHSFLNETKRMHQNKNKRPGSTAITFASNSLRIMSLNFPALFGLYKRGE